ncbi:MAG: TetR/AcrR family transcriptional regulator [Bacteroidota bacterium]|nr:TetR/AcrR family transcriptional regulator [Bacteroidota bacterium]
MGHIERKLREKENVRNSILAAARKIATAEGWHAVTIRKIADAIEYTAPIVYEHFENKSDVIRELVISGFKMLYDEVEKAQATESDPEKLLMQLSLIHWDFAFNNTDLFQLMFSLERPVPNEAALAAMHMIKDIFMKITKKSESEVEEIIFNWVCLLNGSVATVMRFKDTPHSHMRTLNESRELYIGFINRFIKSIS